MVIEKIPRFLIGKLGAFDGADGLVTGHIFCQADVVLLGLMIGLIQAEKMPGEGGGAGADQTRAADLHEQVQRPRER